MKTRTVFGKQGQIWSSWWEGLGCRAQWQAGPWKGGQLAQGGKKEEMRGPDVVKFVEFTVEVGRRW